MKDQSQPNRRSKGEGFKAFIDVLMLVVVLVNLVFLTFDWCFSNVFFQNFVKQVSYDFFIIYHGEVHPNFLYYESIFVSIFLTELMIQWAISIISKRYVKWWFYPIIHWYDVLGSIPLGYFAWLRLFRIVAMILRLHKRGVINLRKTEIYKQFYALYEIVIHDASDRALIQLIDSAQREVKHQSNTSIINYGVKPDQEKLAKALATKIQVVIRENYNLHGGEIKGQIEQAIKDGFDHSEEMEKLEHLPIIGNTISNRLEKLVSDVTVKLADSLSSKLTSNEIAQIMEDIINTSFDSMVDENKELKEKEEIDQQLSNILSDIADRILQKLKEDINSKRKNRVMILSPEE